MNVGFLKKVNFGFTWLVGEVDGAAAVQLLSFHNFDLIFQI